MPASSIVVIGTTASGTVKITIRYDLPAPEDAAGTVEHAIAVLASHGLTAAAGAGYGPEPHDIGLLLDVLIKESALSSQHKLAAALGFTQTQISHYINGIHQPTLDSVKRIADAVAMPCAARRRLGLSAATRDDDAGTGPAAVRVHQVLALAGHIGRTGRCASSARSR